MNRSYASAETVVANHRPMGLRPARVIDVF
jgi:hypothetical protein